MCRSCDFQLQQLRPTVHSLITDTTRTLVQAFISLQLDFCNSFFYCFMVGSTCSSATTVNTERSGSISDWCLPGILSIFNQRCVVFIGYQFTSKLTSIWPLWSIRYCTAYYRRTSLMVVNLLLTPIATSYVHLPPMYVCSSLTQSQRFR